jgi:hypothetical protein
MAIFSACICFVVQQLFFSVEDLKILHVFFCIEN